MEILYFVSRDLVVSVSVMSDSFATPVDCSPLLSSVHGFPKQENWSELPFPSPGDLPYPGIEPRFPALQADALLSELLGKADNSSVQFSRSVVSDSL